MSATVDLLCVDTKLVAGHLKITTTRYATDSVLEAATAAAEANTHAVIVNAATRKVVLFEVVSRGESFKLLTVAQAQDMGKTLERLELKYDMYMYESGSCVSQAMQDYIIANPKEDHTGLTKAMAQYAKGDEDQMFEIDFTK